MGYVFTDDEFTKGKIPNPQNYREAMLRLTEALEEFSARDYIYGANIHGSNFHADGGVGSDIDILVVFEDGPEESLRGLRDKVKVDTHVPVEFVPIRKSAAEGGYHGLDSFYVSYIKAFCSGGVVGRNPLDVVTPAEGWASPAKEVRERLTAQLKGLAKQRSMLPIGYDQERCGFLEKLMRQPLYAAIDLLRLKHGGAYPSKDGKPLSKGECVELFRHEFKEFPEVEAILPSVGKILETRNMYRRFLTDPGPDTARGYKGYKFLLQQIQDRYPHALFVVERSLDFIMRRPELEIGPVHL